MSNLPPKPKPTDPAWVRKEKWRKRREAREATRISSDHELSGVRHRQPHRDKGMNVSWSEGPDGALHVRPTSIPVATVRGYAVSQEDWDAIFTPKSKADPPSDEPQEDPVDCEER
jgi:hypothetical protein